MHKLEYYAGSDYSSVVEVSGFEPLTPCLQSKCSDRAELHPHKNKNIL